MLYGTPSGIRMLACPRGHACERPRVQFKVTSTGLGNNNYDSNYTWEFQKIRGTLPWGPYNKVPTI